MRQAKVNHVVARRTALALLLATASGCSESRSPGGPPADAGVIGLDSGAADSGAVDAARLGDAGSRDSGLGDAGAEDAALADAGTSDAGPSGDPCGRLMDALLVVSTPSGPADFSCLGEPRASGPVADVTLRVVDFQTADYVSGIEVHAFVAGRVLDGPCAAPDCIAAFGSASGLAAVRAHVPGELAYRALPHMGPTAASTSVSTLVYGVAVGAGGGPVVGAVVSLATLNLVPTVLGFRRAMGTAVVMGDLHDCLGRPVSGLRTCVVADGAPVIEGVAMSSPHYRYFNGDSFPSPTATETQSDGLFGVYNVPVAASGSWADVTVYGRLVGEIATRELFRTRVRMAPDAVTVVTQRP